ncbi:MAG TPA: DUF72 domain-containing protein [Thermoanaerobaculia bacterium]|nr:DUF72 domain-containing protein [Thermoanaerobaculia bacterium]
MIRVGTAGWAYEDWKSIVYPSRPSRGFDRLGMMASLFDTNEINSPFYRIPTPRQTADWSRRVAHNPGFAFTAKLHRGFTHERKAGSAEEKEYLEAVEPLQRDGRLGCVLAQFPVSFHGTAENRGLLTGILDRFASLPLAVEFRHESWDTEEVRELLAARDAAFVNIDQPGLRGNLRPTGYVTSPVAYFRFHGRNAEKWFGPDTSNEERYNYLYSDKELAPWVERIRAAAQRAAGLRAEASPPPQRLRRVGDPAEAGVYAILNNHFRGQAVTNALQLQQMLTGEIRSIPETLRDAYPTLGVITRGVTSPAQRKLF